METFSVIIPVKPGGRVAAAEHLKNLLPANCDYEVLVAAGTAPSLQRNRAADAAAGDILYFLDDDSLLGCDNFEICSERLRNRNVAIVGGPSLTPKSDSWLQKLFGAALASTFGSGGVSSRYRATGEVRRTTDRELILCNLAIRRDLFLTLGGFDERLYPNEENEFMERAVASGYLLLHDPKMAVERSQRKNVSAFIRQIFAYGRGRGEQTLLTGRWSTASFIPMLFVVYLLFIPFYAKNISLLLPLVLYSALALLSALLIVTRTGQIFFLLLPLVYLLMHVANGIGLICGLLRGGASKQNCDVTVLKIKEMGGGFV